MRGAIGGAVVSSVNRVCWGGGRGSSSASLDRVKTAVK